MTAKLQRKSAEKQPAAPDKVLPVVAASLPVAGKNARGSVDDMQGDALKAYARKVGIKERDIQGLSEDRLRQNIRAMIHAAMEDE